MNCMSVEYLVLSTVCLALGFLGSLASKWSLQTKLYSLEDRLSLVEGSLLRETKSRAATARWQKQSVEEAAIEAALLTKETPVGRKPKWFEGLVPKSNGTGS